MATYLLSPDQRNYLIEIAKLFRQGLSAEWAISTGGGGEIRAVSGVGGVRLPIPRPSWNDLGAFADAGLLELMRDGAGKVVVFRFRIERVLYAVDNNFEMHPSLVGGNEYITMNIERNYGNAAIKSTFENTVQIINDGTAIPDSMKDALKTLFEQLATDLKSLENSHPTEAVAIEKYAGDLAGSLAVEKPNRTIVKISSEGLVKAAETVSAVAPKVVTTAVKIAAALSPLINP